MEMERDESHLASITDNGCNCE